MKHTAILLALGCLAVGATTTRGQTPSPSCAPSGGLTFICGVQNPEDLVIVPNTRWMLASGMAPGSGLHLVDTREKRVTRLYGIGAATARADRARFSNCPSALD
ncbi:MAG TPA: hypothetical protein VIY56_03845, partial [Vicinamibacterales bacterium]